MSNPPHWLAQEIKRIRLESGINIVELSRLSGVSGQAIGAFENGHNHMYVQKIEQVLDALGYEIDIHAK
tara:strand:- start:4457 stop:4663 length:207 start_codon:yes stop_codon:yes gene_type:complete